MNPIPDWWYADTVREATMEQLRRMIEREERAAHRAQRPASRRTYHRSPRTRT